MALEVHLSRPIQNDDAAQDLVTTLQNESVTNGLDDAILYYGYPRYRDEDDELVTAELLVMSPQHGVIIFGTLNSTQRSTQELGAVRESTEAVLSRVY